jgi:hypothetical protein
MLARLGERINQKMDAERTRRHLDAAEGRIFGSRESMAVRSLSRRGRRRRRTDSPTVVFPRPLLLFREPGVCELRLGVETLVTQLSEVIEIELQLFPERFGPAVPGAQFFLEFLQRFLKIGRRCAGARAFNCARATSATIWPASWTVRVGSKLTPRTRNSPLLS